MNEGMKKKKIEVLSTLILFRTCKKMEKETRERITTRI